MTENTHSPISRVKLHIHECLEIIGGSRVFSLHLPTEIVFPSSFYLVYPSYELKESVALKSFASSIMKGIHA